MDDGNHTIYVLQCRRAAETPWLEPDGPLQETTDKKWVFASKDFFAQQTDHEVWSTTGRDGWWNIDDARKALARVRERDEEGAYDSTDNYKKKCQRVKHDFRLVKLELTKKTTLV